MERQRYLLSLIKKQHRYDIQENAPAFQASTPVLFAVMLPCTVLRHRYNNRCPDQKALQVHQEPLYDSFRVRVLLRSATLLFLSTKTALFCWLDPHFALLFLIIAHNQYQHHVSDIPYHVQETFLLFDNLLH